jgi:hypothetical protein
VLEWLKDAGEDVDAAVFLAGTLKREDSLLDAWPDVATTGEVGVSRSDEDKQFSWPSSSWFLLLLDTIDLTSRCCSAGSSPSIELRS